MAIAVYDSDLTATNGGELTTATTVGNWDESTDGGYDDGGGAVAEVNFYIQGAECISGQFTKTGVGTLINIQGASFTVDTDGAILIWSFWASPSSLTTYANGGIRTLLGDSLGDFYTYKASGSDFEPNPIGGWYNFALDPASATIDTTVGSPTGTWTHVGTAINASAQSRGNPHAVDAIRVGRCSLEVTLGDATEYGTFSGMSNFDTSTDQRYALFQKIFGGYKWQGLMSLGLTGTVVDFRDSNATINVANTPQVSVNFNKIEIHNAASNIEWTSISVSAQDGVNDLVAVTASTGKLEVVDNATVLFTTCSFTDMSTFVFQSNSTMVSTVFRRCDLITQGGGTFTSCTIDASIVVVALLSDNPSLLSYNNFIQGGSGHAIQCDTVGTYTWSGNTDSGYTGTRGTNLVSDSGSTDAMFYNNSGGLITLNVSNGADSPSVRNGTGATTQINATFTHTITGLELNTEVTYVTAGTATVLYTVENASASDGDGKYQVTYSHGGGETVDILIHHVDYKPDISNIYGVTLPSSTASAKVAMFLDENYNNP